MAGAACLGALAIAVGVGAWAGRVVAPEQGAQPAATRVVRAGVATLAVPREWRTVSSRGTGLAAVQAGTTEVLAPSPGSPDRVIVTLAPVEDGSLVPQALRGLVSGLGRGPRATRLAGRRAWLYSALPSRSSHGAIDVTVLPSAAGVLGVACISAGTGSRAATDCASAIRSASVGGATIFVPSQDLALRLRLPRVLAALNGARVRTRAELRRAGTPSGQARLARGAAREHLAAADSLRPVAGAAEAPLVDRLSVAARAYLALGHAANGRSASRFDSARQAVESAEARLAEAVDRVVTRGARQPAVAQPTPAQARLPATTGSDAPTILLLLVLVPGLLAVGLGAPQLRRRLGSAPSRRIGGPDSTVSAQPAPAGTATPSLRRAPRVERPAVAPFVRWDEPPRRSPTGVSAAVPKPSAASMPASTSAAAREAAGGGVPAAAALGVSASPAYQAATGAPSA